MDNILPFPLSYLRQVYPGWGTLLSAMTQKTLRSSDVKRILGISYRQINDWESRGVLESILLRSSKGKGERWRKFSIADLFCLGIIREAKQRGISITSLRNLVQETLFTKDLLYQAFPYLVHGLDVLLYTNLESWAEYYCRKKEESEIKLPLQDISESKIVVLLPINGIVEEVLNKLELSHFQTTKKPNGSFSFILYEVPLALEDISENSQRVRD